VEARCYVCIHVHQMYAYMYACACLGVCMLDGEVTDAVEAQSLGLYTRVGPKVTRLNLLLNDRFIYKCEILGNVSYAFYKQKCAVSFYFDMW
jgi:hypothetical protein